LALVGIARLYVEIGEFGQALESIMMMEDEFLKGLELDDMASKCSNAGELHQALVAAKTIMDKDSESWALADIAVGYAQIGAFHQAFKIIESLPNENEKFWALARIVGEIVKLNEDDLPTLMEITHAIRPLSQFWESIDQ